MEEKPKKKRKWWILVLVLAIVFICILAMAGGVIYYYYFYLPKVSKVSAKMENLTLTGSYNKSIDLNKVPQNQDLELHIDYYLEVPKEGKAQMDIFISDDEGKTIVRKTVNLPVKTGKQSYIHKFRLSGEEGRAIAALVTMMASSNIKAATDFKQISFSVAAKGEEKPEEVTTGKGPEKTIEAHFAAQNNSDYQTVWNTLSSNYQKKYASYEDFEKQYKKSHPPGVTYEIIDKKIEDDEATFDIDVKEQWLKKSKYILIKEGGDWKIDQIMARL